MAEEAISEGIWEGHQIYSPQQWLALQAGLSPQRARVIVEIAENRSKFPAVTEVFDRGELSVDQVAVAVKAPDVNDESLSQLARACTVTQLRRVVRNYVADEPSPPQPADTENSGSDEDLSETGGEPGSPTFRRETCSLTALDNGWFRLSADLNFENGTILQSALAEAKDALFHNQDRQNGNVTLADALVEVANRSLDSVERAARRDRFKAYIHLEGPQLGTAVTTRGMKIPDSLREKLFCDMDFQVVWESDGVPVNVGRTQRIVPDRTRRLVLHRDQGCRVPGCNRDQHLDIHHINHWEHDGPTDTPNLVALCGSHHKLHHQGLLGIEGNADIETGEGALRFTNQHGRPITVVPPIPPTGPPPKPRGDYVHPTGEHLDINEIYLG